MTPDRRRPLLQLLARYRARHPEEAPTVDRFTDFVRSHPECFDRGLAIGHLTASAWLLSRDRRRVLLTHHRKLDAWLQLGGHADGESDLLRAAHREAVEESGIPDIEPIDREIFDLDIHQIPEHPDSRGQIEPAHLHYDVRFAFATTDSESFRVSTESHALAWLEIAGLEERAHDPSVSRMARKWLEAHLPDPPGGPSSPSSRGRCSG